MARSNGVFAALCRARTRRQWALPLLLSIVAACEADPEPVDGSIRGGAGDGSYSGSLDGGWDAASDLVEAGEGDGAVADGGSGDARSEQQPEPGRLAGITA